MNKQTLTALATAISITFSAGAMAQNITKDAYKARQDQIASEFKSDKLGCKALSGNTNDICIAEAKGKMNVANAELDASYQPTDKSHYKIAEAKADSDYAVAKEKCDDAAGNKKDVCLKKADAAKVATLAEANAQVETSAINKKANEEASEARDTASEKTTEVRSEAASDKRDADYAVAKEKCDAFSGDAKDSCVNDAKLRFGE